MALHLIGGLLLGALGIMIFLAVVVSMTGDVFAGMRQVCHGLAGGLAFLLPVVPIWGGALVLMAIQRKPPLRAFGLFSLLLLLLLTAANLLSTSGNPAIPLMEHLVSLNKSRSTTPAAFDLCLARAYELGSRSGMGGGLFGMLLAWPLWQMIDVIPSAIIVILLAIVDFLFLIRLDVKKLLGMAQQRASQRRAVQEQEQQRLREQELLWQQQQAALAQQQAMQQGPAWGPYAPPEQNYSTQPYQPAPQPPYQQPCPPPYTPPMPQPGDFSERNVPVGFQPTPEERGETTWYPPAEPQPEQPTRPSKIFSRKSREKQPEDAPATPTPEPRVSRIFGGRKIKPEQPPRQSVPAQQPAPAWTEESSPQDDPAWQAEPLPQADPTVQEDEWQTDPPESNSWPEKTARIATWREEEPEEPASQPAPRRPKIKQQPKPSWSETPPWEDASETPAGLAQVPKLQQDPPKDAWTPDLKLPPRKETKPQQIEMELPPPYVYPSLNLLKVPQPQEDVSPEEDAIRSQLLEETLSSFKVPAKVRHVTHGPAISRFELELAPGINVTKVSNLDKNIAMNMEVKSVRIEAPIPGKPLVGVEVPNRHVSTVTLREVMESDQMRAAKTPLMVALGKDIAGTPILCDLARMPHLLIAGATGSGKSVCINTMINSLLFRCSPHEVRLILVDPKVVELQCYNGIPHLLIPVVSDPHKAAGALAWAVAEMMDRYKKFEAKGVRAIDGYNSKLEDGEEFMPRIVIIIDELADLMMTCKREVEDHICRLAQLARAAGIHLVVATQRPSVNVITGLIKANIPSRIAFKVTSFIDSRTILDKMGAEQLLGWGDMLYMPTGEFTPIRVQGCFLSDDEVNRITEFIRENCEAEYDPNVIEQLERLESESAGPVASADTVETDDPNSDASLLMQCIEMAVNDGQISTSLLQRRLKVGYARAGRLVDEMEKRGVVSAKDGAKPRMCLISREEFERMCAEGDLDE